MPVCVSNKPLLSVHWICIASLLVCPAIEPQLPPLFSHPCQVSFTLDASFRLSDLLKLELHKYAEDVGEIVDRAQKEEKMEAVSGMLPPMQVDAAPHDCCSGLQPFAWKLASTVPALTHLPFADSCSVPQALAKLRDTWTRVEFVFTAHTGGAAGGKQVGGGRAVSSSTALCACLQKHLDISCDRRRLHPVCFLLSSDLRLQVSTVKMSEEDFEALEDAQVVVQVRWLAGQGPRSCCAT